MIDLKEFDMKQGDTINILWRRSSYSSAAGQCVEIAHRDTGVAVRDSKNPNGPMIVFTTGRFAAFIQRA